MVTTRPPRRRWTFRSSMRRSRQHAPRCRRSARRRCRRSRRRPSTRPRSRRRPAPRLAARALRHPQGPGPRGDQGPARALAPQELRYAETPSAANDGALHDQRRQGRQQAARGPRRNGRGVERARRAGVVQAKKDRCLVGDGGRRWICLRGIGAGLIGHNLEKYVAILIALAFCHPPRDREATGHCCCHRCFIMLPRMRLNIFARKQPGK